MLKKSLLLVSLTTAVMASAPSALAVPLTEADVAAILERTLLQRPELVVRALQQVQRQGNLEKDKASTAAVRANAKALFEDPDSPVSGNPQGTVTVVEFADYRCGYCKRVDPVVKALLAKDPSIRLVTKEWPILGPESRLAAKAALAARAQGKHAELSAALMATKEPLNEEVVMGIAKLSGLDVNALLVTMRTEAAAIDAELAEVHNLATALGISGTPAFVIGDKIIRGAADYQTFAAAVQAARNETADRDQTETANQRRAQAVVEKSGRSQ